MKSSATWSIIIIDAKTGEIGIAGASCTSDCSGIGSVVPGKGAIIVQAMSNYNAHDVGRRLIREGFSLDEILNKVLLQARFDPQHQQYALVTIKEMSPMTYTGDSTIGYKGSLTASGVSIQGNLLLHENELRKILKAVVRTRKKSMSIYDTLVSALEAGAKSGGDKRCGRKIAATSAFLVVAKSADKEDSPTLKLVVTDKDSRGGSAVAVLRNRYDEWKRTSMKG